MSASRSSRRVAPAADQDAQGCSVAENLNFRLVGKQEVIRAEPDRPKNPTRTHRLRGSKFSSLGVSTSVGGNLSIIAQPSEPLDISTLLFVAHRRHSFGEVLWGQGV